MWKDLLLSHDATRGTCEGSCWVALFLHSVNLGEGFFNFDMWAKGLDNYCNQCEKEDGKEESKEVMKRRA